MRREPIESVARSNSALKSSYDCAKYLRGENMALVLAFRILPTSRNKDVRRTPCPAPSHVLLTTLSPQFNAAVIHLFAEPSLVAVWLQVDLSYSIIVEIQSAHMRFSIVSIRLRKQLFPQLV